MIRIQEMPNGNPMIISSVTDFSDSMGFCELRIKHFLKGIKPPQTNITIEGTKSHEKEAEYEKEHFKFVPVSQEELANFKKDIEFAREAVYTRFLTKMNFGNKAVVMLIIGQSDKVARSKGMLIVEDTKFPQNTEKYKELSEPYDDQKLQTLMYLNSRFSETDSLSPKDWFKIPHKEKVWIVNIKDKNTMESVRVFKGTQTRAAEEFLKEKLSRFALIALGIQERALARKP
jgi:hypothetical protein